MFYPAFLMMYIDILGFSGCRLLDLEDTGLHTCSIPFCQEFSNRFFFVKKFIQCIVHCNVSCIHVMQNYKMHYITIKNVQIMYALM